MIILLRRTILVAILLALSSAFTGPWVLASQNKQSEWSTATLMELLGGVQAADLTFTEQRTSTFLFDEIKLTGKMTYRAPDQIEKFVETPFVENIRINGDQISIEKVSNRGKSTTRTYSLAASEALRTTVESIRATLSGNLDSLKHNYDVEMTGDISDWSVELTPKSTEVRGLIERIAVSGSDSKIRVIEIHDSDGDQSRLTLSYQMIR